METWRSQGVDGLTVQGPQRSEKNGMGIQCNAHKEHRSNDKQRRFGKTPRELKV